MKRTLVGILALFVLLVPTAAHATPPPETKTLEWTLPNGGTRENVTWPQPPYVSECGVWVQVDIYPYGTAEEKTRTDALDDDGLLTYGEDHGWVKSWSFRQAAPCVTPTPTEEPTSTPSPTPEPSESATPTTTPSSEPTPTPSEPNPTASQPSIPTPSSSPSPAPTTETSLPQPSVPTTDATSPEPSVSQTSVATSQPSELAVTGPTDPRLWLIATCAIALGVGMLAARRRKETN